MGEEFTNSKEAAETPPKNNSIAPPLKMIRMTATYIWNIY